MINSLLPENPETLETDVLLSLIKSIDTEYQNAMEQVTALTKERDTLKTLLTYPETIKKNNSQVEKLNRLLLKELISLRVNKVKGCPHCHKVNTIFRALNPTGAGLN